MAVNPDDYVITRKRKKYRFAVFANSPLCFEMDEWDADHQVDVLEVGAGTALFLVEQAAMAPEQQFVAVDVKADRLQKGALLAEERGLTNICFVRARADQLAECIRPNSLKRIWVTFPDPFPKKRAAKHRLTHVRFLEVYRTLLGRGGSLCFKTDAHELFDWSIEELVAHKWRVGELTFDLHESQLDASYKLMTTYERRFVAEGLPIQFLRAAPPAR